MQTSPTVSHPDNLVMGRRYVISYTNYRGKVNSFEGAFLRLEIKNGLLWCWFRVYHEVREVYFDDNINWTALIHISEKRGR